MATSSPTTVQTMVAASAVAQNQMIENLQAQVAAIIAGFSSWYDDAAVAAMAAQIGRLVVPAQRVAASLQDAYLAQIASAVSSRTFRPVGPANLAALRGGIGPETAYQRLGEQYRYTRSTGASDADSVARTATRADVLTDMDVRMAARAQTTAFMRHFQIVNYRRVLHPELDKGGPCGMCIRAASQIQSAAKPMPLHGRCRCAVIPIVDGVDVGHALNQSDLKTLAAQGLPTAHENYRVVDNAETGPTLTRL
jgi:hypothetical protein